MNAAHHLPSEFATATGADPGNELAAAVGRIRGNAVEVRLLGPIDVIGPRGPAILQGARQRTLLAILALQPGASIAASRIVDGLWGEQAPRTALRTLQSHVTRLRQALAAAGLPDAVHTAPSGHALKTAADNIDLHRFEGERRRAKAADPARALALLEGAMSLWRGEAFQDAEPHAWLAGEIDRVHESRAAAVEDLSDVRLRLGLNDEAVGDLRLLLAADPYRERTASLLMLALYRGSRPAEALEVYQRLRQELCDTLGVDPSAELQQLHTAILRQDTSLDLRQPRQAIAVADSSSPAELPPRVGYFSGRAEELSGLDKMLAVRDADTDSKLVLISGVGGMGKTAIAVEWAHRVKERFPDGQLFVDLQGHDARSALAPTQVVAHLLRGLGVANERIPAEIAGQTNLYRSLTHERKMLVLLDNAQSIDQVMPAVPATRQSLLIVTSRQELSALAVRQPVHFVDVQALDEVAGLELLRRAVDTERIERERDWASDLVKFCGGMPLAMRIAAAKLASRPSLRVGELVGDLRLRQLDALAVPGDSAGIRAVFASAYLSLSAPARRLFRRLGWHPGASFSLSLAATADGCTSEEAAKALAELTGANLVNTVGGRFQFHDLIRLYAAECANIEDSEAVRAETGTRIIEWFLNVAFSANQTLDPKRDRVKLNDVRDVGIGSSHHEVLAFLDAERFNLLPVVAMAAERGEQTKAWQLAYLLVSFYDSRGHVDRVKMLQLAVSATEDAGDPLAEVLMRNNLAASYVAVRQYEKALAELESALPIAETCSDTWYLAATYNNMAVANIWLRRYEAALAATRQSLSLHTVRNVPADMALALNNIGDLHSRMGQHEDAVSNLSAALIVLTDVDNPRMKAIIRQSLGQAYVRAGNHPRALEELAVALALRQQIGDRRGEANALLEAARAHAGLDNHASAKAELAKALAICEALENEHLTAIVFKELASVHLQTNDPKTARRFLQKAIAIRERIPDAYEEAVLQELLGDLSQKQPAP